MTQASVYWAKLPEHFDVTTQGYVGFALNPKRRWQYHKADARRGSQNTFAKALRKYGDRVQFSVLCVSNETYCLDLERKLRPVGNIGWNIGPGGRAAMLGRKHTAEAIAKMRKNMKGLRKSDAARLAIGAAQRGRKLSDAQCEKLSIAAKRRVIEIGFTDAHRSNISAAKRGVPTGVLPWLNLRADVAVWRRAIEICARLRLGEKHSTIGWKLFGDRSKLKSMNRKFLDGWVPETDSEYLAWHAKFDKE